LVSNILPDSTSPLLNGASFLNPRLTDTFFTVVNHRGAFGEIDWTAGWSNFRPDTLTTSVRFVSAVNVSVYPNPFCDLIHIESDSEIMDVSIYDFTGRKLQIEYGIENTNGIVVAPKLSAGVYILSVNCKNGSIVKRVVKN